MLNLLQRACGIATATRAYVDAVAGTGCRILHTRKTAPGLRALDIAAVLAGGGDRAPGGPEPRGDGEGQPLAGALRSGGTLADALDEARRRGVTRALRGGRVAGAARAGLRGRRDPAAGGQSDAGDGASAGAAAPGRLRPGIEIEATGGITLENVRAYAEAGADFVSVGALTHSVQAADLALEVQVVS